MDAITKVNICPATFCKHDFGSGGALVFVGMAGFIVRGTVGFGFDDHAGGGFAVYVGDDEFAEQGFTGLDDVFLEEEGALYLVVWQGVEVLY